MILKSAIILGESGPDGNDNEMVLDTPQTPKLESHYQMQFSYITKISFLCGRSLNSLQGTQRILGRDDVWKENEQTLNPFYLFTDCFVNCFIFLVRIF